MSTYGLYRGKRLIIDLETDDLDEAIEEATDYVVEVLEGDDCLPDVRVVGGVGVTEIEYSTTIYQIRPMG